MMKNQYLRKRDKVILDRIISEIKKIPGIIGIFQIGSSTYSKNYHDIDVLIFFESITHPKLKEIRKRYAKNKFWIEGVFVNAYKISRGVKVFIKFFNHLKTKKILYVKNPYQNEKMTLNKLDVASYIDWSYVLTEQYGLNYDNLLSVCLNAILTYKNIFPENKDETLRLFKKTYPNLAKYLPKNAEYYLRKTNEKNFKNLYTFFKKSIEFFMR